MFDNRLQPSNEPLIPSSYTTTEQAQPLFTLTAEEVEIVERNLTYFFKSDKEEVDKILTRIKQWQDENKNT